MIELAEKCLCQAQAKGLCAYSIGWFIHNPTVVNRFIEKGMIFIEDPEDGPAGIALIRAHGIGDPLRQRFIDAGFELIDGTCATVAHSQKIIRAAKEDMRVVVIGSRLHSEVAALTHVWDARKQLVPVLVVESVKDVDMLFDDEGKDILLMTQTTFPQASYQSIRKRMEERFYGRVHIGNRLCPITYNRHAATAKICEKSDAVLVIGGHASANTQALVQLVRGKGLPVWHIETAREIPIQIFNFARVGVTAGASTPPQDIEAVISVLKGGA